MAISAIKYELIGDRKGSGLFLNRVTSFTHCSNYFEPQAFYPFGQLSAVFHVYSQQEMRLRNHLLLVIVISLSLDP
jgi:hypothetical protein